MLVGVITVDDGRQLAVVAGQDDRAVGPGGAEGDQGVGQLHLRRLVDEGHVEPGLHRAAGVAHGVVDAPHRAADDEAARVPGQQPGQPLLAHAGHIGRQPVVGGVGLVAHHLDHGRAVVAQAVAAQQVADLFQDVVDGVVGESGDEDAHRAAGLSRGQHVGQQQVAEHIGLARARRPPDEAEGRGRRAAKSARLGGGQEGGRARGGGVAGQVAFYGRRVGDERPPAGRGRAAQQFVDVAGHLRVLAQPVEHVQHLGRGVVHEELIERVDGREIDTLAELAGDGPEANARRVGGQIIIDQRHLVRLVPPAGGVEQWPVDLADQPLRRVLRRQHQVKLAALELDVTRGRVEGEPQPAVGRVGPRDVAQPANTFEAGHTVGHGQGVEALDGQLGLRRFQHGEDAQRLQRLEAQRVEGVIEPERLLAQQQAIAVVALQPLDDGIGRPQLVDDRPLDAAAHLLRGNGRGRVAGVDQIGPVAPHVVDALEGDLIGAAKDEVDRRAEAVRAAAVGAGRDDVGDGAQVVDVGRRQSRQLAQGVDDNCAGDAAKGVGVGQNRLRRKEAYQGVKLGQQFRRGPKKMTLDQLLEHGQVEAVKDVEVEGLLALAVVAPGHTLGLLQRLLGCLSGRLQVVALPAQRGVAGLAHGGVAGQQVVQGHAHVVEGAARRGDFGRVGLFQRFRQGRVLGIDAQQQGVQLAQEGQQQPRLGVGRGQRVVQQEDVFLAVGATTDGRRLTTARGIAGRGRRSAVGRRLVFKPLRRLQPQGEAGVGDRVLFGAENNAHAFPGWNGQRPAVQRARPAVVERLADGDVAPQVHRQVVAGGAQPLPTRVVLAELGQLAVGADARPHQPPLRLRGHVGHARQVAPGVGFGAAVVVVLAHGAAEVDVVVSLGGRRQQQRRGSEAQEVLDGQTIGRQLELVRPFTGIDDAPLGVNGVSVVQPDGVERLFQQEGVEGHLDEVLVAGGLAGLEVPDAQPAAAAGRWDDLQQIGAGRADADEGRIEVEAPQKVRGVVGRRLQIDENLRREARRRGAAQHLGQVGQRQGAHGAAAVVVVEAHVVDLVGAVVALELFQPLDLEVVAGRHEQRDTGAAVEAGRLGYVPADAAPAAVGLLDAIPAVLAVATVLEVGGDGGGAKAILLVHGAPLVYRGWKRMEPQITPISRIEKRLTQRR